MKIMKDSSLYSEDLAPVPLSERTWNTWNYAALWISMSLCIPTYMLASSLIEGGMNWWQAILTIFLGNTIVLAPMILNGHAGAKYGIPFPVLARASFGVRLANLPAILRAIVACGWFGIQTWIGGFSLYQMFKIWFPSFATLPRIFPESFSLETGPANDFSNLAPARINFRMGGYITGIFGILIFPWKLIADPTGYIFTWLIAYSSLLGPIGGIMIADYYFIRKKELFPDDLYAEKGRYTYRNGYNMAALWALLAGILPNVPGFLVAINVLGKETMPHFITGLYHYAWFVGFAVSFCVYLLLMKKKK